MSGQISFDFEGRRVLVTGGTSGIGEATALAFARAGARVVIAGRNRERAQEVIRAARKLPGKLAFVVADLTERVFCRI